MDDRLANYFQYDIELTLCGPTSSVVNKWAADTLRGLADRIERGSFEERCHQEVNDRVGKPIGTVYVECSHRHDMR